MSDPAAKDPAAKDRAARDRDERDHDESDSRWLLARERGEDISHVPAGARAPYEQLGALLGSGLAPRAGFRQRVLDRIDAEERGERPIPGSEAAEPDAMGGLPGVAPSAPAPIQVPVLVTAPPAEQLGPPGAPVVPIRPRQQTGPAPVAPAAEPAAPAGPGAAESNVVPFRKKRPWRWIAAGGLAAAAAAAVLVATSPGRGTEPTPQLAVKSEVRAGTTVLRADAGTDQARVGERLVVRARVHGSGEVRVYGGSNGRLLASCKHPGGCTGEGDGEHRWLVLEVPLDAPGTVRTVVFAGDGIPASAGSFTPDLEAAERADVRYEIDKRIWRVL